ncbi:MAG: DEAD/DEAH box helicase domain protein [candidate division TM6 bacterium GW2011_GWE2_41_16]|nr:MAG: DEAD/DEAH box helicase domain protein [candidate division TM6 bacterium GW2011_GWE2_41_16]
MTTIPDTFQSMTLLKPAVQETLARLGFTTPTDIQRKAIPYLLATSHAHMHGQAQTGTGKTLAFGLPLVQRIDTSSRKTQALVVAPTRELALQIYEALKPFTDALSISMTAVYGGVSLEDQFRKLSSGQQIVIGTPGRINDHLKRKTLVLDHLKTLVLDEADIMLDMGFREEVEIILNKSNRDKEIWLFSATVKSGISDLMRTHMPDTHTIRVSQKGIGTTTVKQFYCIAPIKERVDALARFIESAPDFYGFIFCQTKLLTSEIAERLSQKGFPVGALHGDLSQPQRNFIVKKFKNRDITIVVATDVAARGIDIADLTHVINFSLPEDLESYVHRIGRTGRAGKEGIAISFIPKSEIRTIRILEKRFSVTIQPILVPSLKDITMQRLNALYKKFNIISEMSADHQYTANTELETLVKENLNNHVSTYSPEILRQLFVSYLFEASFKELLKQSDIAQHAQNNHHSDELDSSICEVSLGVGSEDGLSQEELLQHIIDKGFNPEDLKKVRVIRRKSFVIVGIDHCARLIELLKFDELKGRRLNPRKEMAREEFDGGDRRGGDRFQRSEGGRSSRGGYSRGGEGRSGGGYARRDSSRRGPRSN